MIISKGRMAAAVSRFPFALQTIHAVWRLSRPHFTAGAIAVLFNVRGEVLLVEHVYHVPPRWGLPGGYVDRGEDPQDTICRELHEELGLTATVVRVAAVTRSTSSHLDIAYLCRSDSVVEQICDELLAYRWTPPDQLPEIRPFHRQAIQAALALVDAPV